MAANLERLAQYYREKQNTPRADFYSALAAEERASKTPENFSEGLVLPEGVVRLPDLIIGGLKPKELGKALASGGHRISDYAEDLMKKMPTLKDQKIISLVRATPSAMGLSGNPTRDQIYERADKLNWDLCPAEVGPHLRLAYKDQPMNEWLAIAMKPITDRVGNPRLFNVERLDGGSWLDTGWAGPTGQWDPNDSLVFSPRK